MFTNFETRMFEYESAANPQLPEIPICTYNIQDIHSPNWVNDAPIDLSQTLNTDYICTTPNLLCSFITINHCFENYYIPQNVDFFSKLFYIISGVGEIYCELDDGIIYNFIFRKGDLIVLPKCASYKILPASKDMDSFIQIYSVDDSPLYKYLKVKNAKPTIVPTLYKKYDMETYLREVMCCEDNKNKNRNGILLSNTEMERIGTKTLTPILWSLLNVVRAHCVQKPHRHNSVALDYCVKTSGNVYTIMGKELDENNNIKDPIKVMWEQGSFFITPPGYWHSHINESDEEAVVLPVQDAGLYTYQRTLNIEFVK